MARSFPPGLGSGLPGAFPSRVGLSGVICEPWGLPLTLAITLLGILLGIHVHSVSQRWDGGGTMLGALARMQVGVGEGKVGGALGPSPCTSAPGAPS